MEPSLITGSDYLLLLVYWVLFYFIFKFAKHFFPDNFLIQKYLIPGFFVKTSGAIFFALLVFYYYGFGDTLSYFRDTMILRQLLVEKKNSFIEIYTTDYEFLRDRFDLMGSVTESGFMVTKIALLLTYFSFSRFLITTFLMANLIYLGVFKLFQTFVYLAPTWHRFIAWIVLFFPSLAIYGSGIFKEPVSISAIGWIMFCSYKTFTEKKLSLLYISLGIFSIFLITVVKSYIIAAFLIPVCLFTTMHFINKIKSHMFRLMSLPILLILIFGLYTVLAEKIDESLGIFAVDKLSENVQGLNNQYNKMSTEDAGSNFEIGAIEPSLAGLIKKMPVGFVATLYRPFLWETRNVVMLFSTLESLTILLFTLYVIKKAGVLSFLKILFTNPVILFFITYSIIFSGFVGISSLNFGTLARYRVPVIPFYLMGLLLIYSKIVVAKFKTKANSHIQSNIVMTSQQTEQ